jgi:MAP1-LC3 domain-containing protein
MEVNNMFEVFLFNVTIGGLVLSIGGLGVLELIEKFKMKYKIVKREGISSNNGKENNKGNNKENSNIKKNIKEKRYHQIKIARNNGIIDIRMTKSENGVA